MRPYFTQISRKYSGVLHYLRLAPLRRIALLLHYLTARASKAHHEFVKKRYAAQAAAAAGSGSAEILRVLLAAGAALDVPEPSEAHPGHTGQTPMVVAASNDNLEGVAFLLARGVGFVGFV